MSFWQRWFGSGAKPQTLFGSGPTRPDPSQPAAARPFTPIPFRRVIICAGPSRAKTQVAEECRRSFRDVDILVCSNATDIEQQLCRYQKISPMLQYFFGEHPTGSMAAQAWSPRFMKALAAQRGTLEHKPNVTMKINKDTGGVFLVCAWDPSTQVRPADVLTFTMAVETAFAQAGW